MLMQFCGQLDPQLEPSAVFLMGTPSLLKRVEANGAPMAPFTRTATGHILSPSKAAPPTATAQPSSRGSPRKAGAAPASPVRRHSMADNVELLVSHIRERIQRASEFGVPLSDEELGIAGLSAHSKPKVVTGPHHPVCLFAWPIACVCLPLFFLCHHPVGSPAFVRVCWCVV